MVVFFLGFIGPVSGWFMTYGLAGILNNLGVATKDAGYFTLASSLATSNSILVGSLVVLAAIILAAVFGTKASFRYQWFTFILMFVGIVTFLVVVGTTSPATFQSNLQSLSSTSYGAIIQRRLSALSSGSCFRRENCEPTWPPRCPRWRIGGCPPSPST